jgi:hypothetical protein
MVLLKMVYKSKSECYMKKCVNCWYLGSWVKYDQGKTPKEKKDG